jgi:predicted deacylase
MKSKLLAILLFVLYQSGFSQVSERLQGQVVFDKTLATKVEVINATSKIVALTDTEGKFIITAEANDQLVFVAKNHEIKELKVTAAIIKQGFINMTLAAKAEELKEVIVQNMTSIKLSKDAKWEQAKLDQYAL